MSSLNRRALRPAALLPAAGLAAALAAAVPAAAQDAEAPAFRGALDGASPLAAPAGGASPLSVPAASGPTRYDADAGAPGGPAPALPTDGGVGTSATGPAGAQPPPKVRGKFALPPSTAKTEDRIRYPRKGPPTLPELQAYPNSVPPSQRPRAVGGDASLALRGSGATVDTVGEVLRPGPTVAALPLPARVRGRVEDAPYEAVGYEVGSLRLRPYITESLGFDSNPDQTQTALRPSAFERTEGGFAVASEWSRNSFSASLHGGYDDFFSAPEANRPDAVGVADYRFDLDRDTTLDAETRFALDTQRVTSPEVGLTNAAAAAAASRPLVTTFGASLGGAETFGRFNVALHGTFDRTAYDNADISGQQVGAVGASEAGYLNNLASQNFNDVGLRLRASYELTPVVQPFVEVFGDDRIHDHEVDYLGFQRDSLGVTGQVGSTFELTRLLTGDLSVGYGGRTYQDPRLRDIRSPVFNGSVSYAATPLTTLSFRAATSFDETNVAGSSGTESRSFTLAASHALLRNLTLNAAVSYLDTNYVGVPITENTVAGSIGAEYHFTRSLVGTATYSHEHLKSTFVGGSFDQDVVLLGLRLQR